MMYDVCSIYTSQRTLYSYLHLDLDHVDEDEDGANALDVDVVGPPVAMERLLQWSRRCSLSNAR